MVKHLTRGVYIDTVAQVVRWVTVACQESVQLNSRMKRVNHPSIILRVFIFNRNDRNHCNFSDNQKRTFNSTVYLCSNDWSSEAMELFVMLLRSEGITSPSLMKESASYKTREDECDVVQMKKGSCR